jgi:branched-chain amino acid transport system substrate-binding protein
MQTAMLVPEAAKLKKKRWAIVYPNYEYGQSATAAFKKLLKEASPTSSSSPSRRRRWARSTPARGAGAGRRQARRDLLLAVRPDLAKFVREGKTRGLFKGRAGGSTCSPASPSTSTRCATKRPSAGTSPATRGTSIKTPEHTKFLAAYQAQVQGLSAPRLGGRLHDRDAVGRRGDPQGGLAPTPRSWSPPFRGLQLIPRRSAMITYRADRPPVDDGRLCRQDGVKDGKGVMVDFRYIDGAKSCQPDAEVGRRAAAAREVRDL